MHRRRFLPVLAVATGLAVAPVTSASAAPTPDGCQAFGQNVATRSRQASARDAAPVGPGRAGAGVSQDGRPEARSCS